MKFRTEIEDFIAKGKIGYGSNIFTVGSCFAQNIAQKLLCAKFRVTTNPTGILFNPASIASTLTSFANLHTADNDRIVLRGSGYVSLDCHSDLIEPTQQKAVEAYNSAVVCGHKALLDADCVIITLGTAFVYEHIATGKVVANCHKLPQREFTRRRLGVDEIVELFTPLLGGILKEKYVIFTVSPVRHIADGLAENSLSKATLRVAVDELCTKFDNADYFPAYECVTDDLRDYRFYADDLVHPSAQAVEYIWEKFSASVLDSEAKALLPKVNKIVTAAAHRPFNPESEEYRTFCNNYLKEAKSLSMIDFSAECEIFERFSDKS